MRTNYRGNVGETTASDPDPLDEYEFDLGDEFVRWVPWGDERADDDLWQIQNRYWKEVVTWIRDRDNVPTNREHRVYELMSRETFDTKMINETELLRGDWRPVADIDRGTEGSE